MGKINTAIFADKSVGKEALEFILSHHKDDLKYVLFTDDSSIVKEIDIPIKEVIHYNINLYSDENISKLKSLELDYIILAWWPYIIKSPLFNCVKKGIINFHPSLLPYNRGKHYNFWNIIEEVPFGVSLHFIDENIDSGDIIFQKEIEKTWEDNGKTLFDKAQGNMTQLFSEAYPEIRKENYNRKKQDLSKGSFHLAKELTNAAKIDLNKSYKARDLINIIRAKTFSPYPAAWFEDDNKKYEITISIKEVSNGEF